MRIEYFPALGTHIDLDHIISVSDVYLTTIPAHSRHVGFAVEYVLRNGPVHYTSPIRDGYENPEFRYVWTPPDGERSEITGEEWLYNDGQWIKAPKHSPPERQNELACVVRWQTVADHLIERWKNPEPRWIGSIAAPTDFDRAVEMSREQRKLECQLDHPKTCTCSTCVEFGLNGAG